ncbi:MAG: NYN domain-containing protein [Rhodospirillaceae bacterium]|nr:NYN domain-containing protein [Rhodospirillaceae bacterium]
MRKLILLHHIHNDETYSLFIDGANLYSAARLLGFDIDYKKLLQSLSGHGRLVRTYYYTAIMENQDYSPIRPLVDWLDYNGYTVITKPAKEFIGDEGKRKIKGDMDVEIAVDMLELSERLDHVVLFSGDGDFRHLVEAVQRKNTRVTVVSTVQSNPPMAADEIRRQADFFVELNDLADCIAKKRLGQQNFDNSADDFESFEDNFNDEAVVEVA